MLTETASLALATFFATIGPLDIAAVFAVLTRNGSVQHNRMMAIRATLIATAILVTFALAGELLLAALGISLAALRAAGGILLLLIGIDMVFGRSSGGTFTTEEEEQEAMQKQDISIFPIATPMIAGPGSMGAAILLMANTEGDVGQQAVVIASLLAVLLLTGICLLLSSQISRLLGITGMQVVSRIMGVLLSALAVQFIFDGVKQSGIFGS
ncbi:MAG: NAAT family transporter [Pseudomonadales bacterium]|nr:NAAT family transporter [Pseudomonadales bacterium]